MSGVPQWPVQGQCQMWPAGMNMAAATGGMSMPPSWNQPSVTPAMATTPPTPMENAMPVQTSTQAASMPSTMPAAMTAMMQPMPMGMNQLAMGMNQFANPTPSAGVANPFQSMTPQANCYPLLVRVEGLTFHYQLTYDDVLKVFSRFGPVSSVEVKAEGNEATVQFINTQHAITAINELDGKQLSGLKGGTLRVAFMDHAQLSQHQQQQQQMAAVGMPGCAPAWQMGGGMGQMSGGMGQMGGMGGMGNMGSGMGGMGNGAMGVNPWLSAAAAMMNGNTPWGDNSWNSGNNNSFNSGSSIKYTAKVEFDMENDPEFKASAKVIAIARKIWKDLPSFQQRGGKTRLRGRGSGYCEGPEQKEADEKLHLCISCKDPNLFEQAIKMAEEGIKDVSREYGVWRASQGMPAFEFGVRVERQTRGAVEASETASAGKKRQSSKHQGASPQPDQKRVKTDWE